MPVRYEDLESDLELPPRFDIYEYMDGIEDILSASQLPSEDVWKKFDILDMNYPAFLDEHFDFQTMHVEDFEPTPACDVKKQQFYSCCGSRYDREIRHHDCMWAGFCLNGEHSEHGSKDVKKTLIKPNEIWIKEPATTDQNQASEETDPLHLVKQEPETMKIKTETIYETTSVNKSLNCESVSVSNSTNVPNTKVVSITTKTNKTGLSPSKPNVITEEIVPRRRYIVQRTVGRSLLPNQSKQTSDKAVTLPVNRVKSESGASVCSSTVSQSVSVVKVSDSVGEICRSPSKVGSKNDWSSNNMMAERPETPQSLPESDDDSTPIAFNNAGQALFKSAIDTIISANPQLPNYDHWDSDSEDSSSALASWPVSEITGQVRRTSVSKMIERNVSVTDSDHNYGLKITSANYTAIKIEDLGVQTPSDSEEEEVDVVSLQDSNSLRSSSRSSSLSREFVPPTPIDEDFNDFSEVPEKPSTYCTKSQRYVKRKRRKSFSYDDDYIPEENKAKAAQSRKRARVVKGKGSGSNGSVSTKSSPIKSRFGSTDSDSETITSDRRSFHNSMERKRRVDLRNSFEELRLLVPRIEHKKRSPKVVILNEAAMYCMELSSSSQKMSAELCALRRQQDGLRAAVSMLRKSLAANR